MDRQHFLLHVMMSLGAVLYEWTWFLCFLSILGALGWWMRDYQLRLHRKIVNELLPDHNQPEDTNP